MREGTVARERYRVILIIPFVVLGFALGFISSRSNGFIWIVAVLSVAIPLVIVAELLCVADSVRKFGEALFTVGIRNVNRFRMAFYVLIVITVLFLIPFLFFPFVFVLPFILFLCLTIRTGVRNRIPGSVNKCGILYWGTHHKWSDITGYTLLNAAGETQIVLYAREKVAGFELDRTMCVLVSPCDKHALEHFVKERIETFRS